MKTDPKPSLEEILFLLTIPSIGPGRIRRLFQSFNTLSQIRKAPVQSLVRIESIDLKLASKIKNGGNQGIVAEQLKLIEKLKIQFVTLWDKNYPALLKQIPDAPPVLFFRGSIAFAESKTIAVVGTRNPSNYGRTIAAELTRNLIDSGITIVSGMARGIDTIAQRTALQNAGITLAVLGCGLDTCYPPENRNLFQQIPDHGAIISEYFIGTGPDAPNFPKRNRIISGLSLGTLVIEAGDKSGALITAFFALNQNREVFAVPGNINSSKSHGCNRLIKLGGKLVQTVDDILEELGLEDPVKKQIPKPVPDNLDPLDKQILQILSSNPTHIDQIVTELDQSPSAILTGLLNLELLGLVDQLAGKKFVRI